MELPGYSSLRRLRHRKDYPLGDVGIGGNDVWTFEVGCDGHGIKEGLLKTPRVVMRQRILFLARAKRERLNPPNKLGEMLRVRFIWVGGGILVRIELDLYLPHNINHHRRSIPKRGAFTRIERYQFTENFFFHLVDIFRGCK